MVALLRSIVKKTDWVASLFFSMLTDLRDVRVINSMYCIHYFWINFIKNPPLVHASAYCSGSPAFESQGRKFRLDRHKRQINGLPVKKMISKSDWRIYHIPHKILRDGLSLFIVYNSGLL